MATIIFILVLLAGYHFIVENIILPVKRDELKCSFIALRDKLIVLKIKNKISDKVFDQLNTIICTSANNIHHFDLLRLITTYRKNYSQRAKSEELFEYLANSKNQEVKFLFDETIKYTGKGFIANSIAWALYLLPFIPVLMVALPIIATCYRLNKNKSFYSYTKAKKAMFIISGQQECSNKIITDSGYNMSGFLPV
jgi:hypothetical protein